MAKVIPQPIITPEFRLSFANIFVAAPDMNGVVRYSMEMLFPKVNGSSQFKELQTIYDKAIAGANFETTPGPAPRTFKQALIDGDTKKQEGRHGNFLLKANASATIRMKDGTSKPNSIRVLNPNRTPAEPSDVYEGCYCRAILTAYPYTAHKDGNVRGPIISRGAAFNIMVVQKTRDGEPFANFITDAQLDDMLKMSPLEGVDEIDALLD